MIPIKRPQPAPTILLTEGAAEEQTLRDRHAAGEREFHFKARIYRHAAVLEALNQSHRAKCCYCEQIVDAQGQIEHYRPKAHYYWLAYRWENLLLACAGCNNSKLEKFPLAKEEDRAETHRDDTNRERRLLLDPTVDDIAAHLGWRSAAVYPRSGAGPGECTIATVKLNRQSLVKRRIELLALVECLAEVATLSEFPVAAKAKVHLEKMQSPTHSFSAMIRSHLQAHFKE